MKMSRKCSYCGNLGHNSRTCSNYRRTSTFVGTGIRLFGVQLDISLSSLAFKKKSFSMDCLTTSSSSSSSLSSSRISIDENSDIAPLNYLSDGLIGRSQHRKKGVPWTQEEHRTFLVGLHKLGKGDWRGISRNYVTTRTPTQVASHAQKYFLRQASLNDKKRRSRSSLFDMVVSGNKMAGYSVKSSISEPRAAAKKNQPDNQKQVEYFSARAASQLNKRPVWLYGLIDRQLIKSSNAAKPNSSNTEPDLDLKLAVSR